MEMGVDARAESTAAAIARLLINVGSPRGERRRHIWRAIVYNPTPSPSTFFGDARFSHPMSDAPAAKPWKLSHLTHADVRKNRYQVAILPLGACEPHNT